MARCATSSQTSFRVDQGHAELVQFATSPDLETQLLNSKVICVGETLWDVLPSGEFLGGAPLNVAAHLSRLGVDARLVTRIGTDTRGREALATIQAIGVSTAYVQVDDVLPTGIAQAVVDATGSATYRFPMPCAWDGITADASAVSAASGATVVFGTLAQRSAASAGAIGQLLDVATWRVFDANLRPPYDDREAALRSLRRADFVKVNEYEVAAFARWLGIAPTPAALRANLAENFGIRSLCVTEGARGSRLWHERSYVEQPAWPTEVVDTIGAGDSFLAMLIAELLHGQTPPVAMDRAARLAAYVASHPGATPHYDPGQFVR